MSGKNKGGRPPFTFNDEQIVHAACERQPEVLERYKRGQAKAIGSVAQSLLMQAREGNLTAAIFYLKTRAGWRETQVVDNVSSDGSMAPAKEIKVSAEDVEAALKRLNESV